MWIQNQSLVDKAMCVGSVYVCCEYAWGGGITIFYAPINSTPTPWEVVYHVLSCSVVSDSLLPNRQQYDRPPCPLLIPRVYSNLSPLSRWCHPTISSSVVPFFSTFNLSQHQGRFNWIGSSHQVAKVLVCQLQHQFFQWTFSTDFL